MAVTACPDANGSANLHSVNILLTYDTKQGKFGFHNGAVAQLGERLNGIQEVVGSIPSGSTNIRYKFKIQTLMYINSVCVKFV